MEISKTSWGRYLSALRKVSNTATEKMLYYIDQFGMPVNEQELADFIWAAYNVSGKYGAAAAELAAEMYDATALASEVMVQAAELAPTPTVNEVAKAVRGTLKTNNPKIVADSVGRLVKMTGVDTTMRNALRDGAEWAWIPSGDTCAFCITLASRGWQRASRSAIKNGHAEHIHANCDCTYAVRFDKNTDVEGYHPDEYLRMYENAEGSTPEAKINFMRREFYAENSEEINAQKRNAYEKRKERESSAAEETIVS